MSVRECSAYAGYQEGVAELESLYSDVVVIESGKRSSADLVSRREMAGLAEQDMILYAAGLALEGRRVFVSAMFSPMFAARTYEQIRASIAIPNLNVVLASVQDGEALDRSGAGRQMNEDFALMRVIPNMSVLAPSDKESARSLVRSLYRHSGPAYVRLSNTDCREIYKSGDDDFHIGGGRLLSEGDGVTICACGIMLKEAMIASDILAQQGISADIIDCYSIKPLPEQMLLASVRRTGCCVVAEKHTNIGGLYGAVAECLCRSYIVPVRSVAMEDKFGDSGTPEELREYYGLTHREIVHNAVQVWAMRRR